MLAGGNLEEEEKNKKTKHATVEKKNSFINSGEKESCNKRDNFNFVHLVEDQ